MILIDGKMDDRINRDIRSIFGVPNRRGPLFAATITISERSGKRVNETRDRLLGNVTVLDTRSDGFARVSVEIGNERRPFLPSSTILIYICVCSVRTSSRGIERLIDSLKVCTNFQRGTTRDRGGDKK